MFAEPAPVPLPVDRQFYPTSVTLFLTNRCNLRCNYCYAQAGEFKPCDMPPVIYRAAIDFVARNVKRAGGDLGVNFHGGGEPTVAWETFTGAVEYARSTHGEAHFAIATNGLMAPDKAEYVAKTVRMVTLSLDGPPDIHNIQRPCADGTDSFDKIMAFVDVLRRHKTPFAIRSTITENNVRRLPELVDFFVERTGCRQLHFEPAFLSGRCSTIPEAVPPSDLCEAESLTPGDRGHARGAQVRFSAARITGAFSSFCGCAQDAFSVTPEGDVTACFEVCSARNSLADTYYFGRYSGGESRFKFDLDRLVRLRSMTVHNKPVCARCFAKWTCAGDCPAKGVQPFTNTDEESPRCRMVQTITQAMLGRAVDAKP
jgi:uncharacterized protein